MPVGKTITKKQSDSLYRLMKFIHDVCVEHNIQYWIIGGTLLGAVRHQGLIPWDDDGDVAILEKDAKKFAKLIPAFEDAGYDIDNSPDEDKEPCVKNKSCSYIINGRGKNDLGCDVFIMKNKHTKKGDIITFADTYWEKADNGGKRCYFLKNHVFPLLPLRFGNFYLYGPNNAISHLNMCYGDDWNSKSQMLYNHRTGKWGSGKKHTMRPQEFAAPVPPKDVCDSNPPVITCSVRK